MSKKRYSRYKFSVRRGVMVCEGQKKTMRGVQYAAQRVYVPLEGKEITDKKRAMELGIVELGQE